MVSGAIQRRRVWVYGARPFVRQISRSVALHTVKDQAPVRELRLKNH